MPSFSNLSASVASETLFESLHISMARGVLTALTGPNGSGKSTLLKLIAADCKARGIACLLLEQGGPGEATTAERSPGINRGSEIFSLLGALPPEGLLLLDEPTNHLDQTAFRAFLDALSQQRASYLLLVTHDRRLLREVDRILHLEEGRLREYGGGYDSYLEEREAESAARARQADIARKRKTQIERDARRSAERQAKRMRRAEARNHTQKEPHSMINAQRERASHTAAQLQKTGKRRMEAAARELALEKANIPPAGRSFAPPAMPHTKIRKGVIARLDEVNFQLPTGPLWPRELSLMIAADARLAVSGANGSGKTTILEAVMGLRKPSRGEIRVFARNPVLLKQMRGRATCESLLEVCSRRVERDPGTLRTALARAGFSANQVQQEAGVLSGGEWIRVELMLAFLQAPDLLLLDEPTNDLDAKSREMLAEVLRETNLPLVCVSHDPEFLEEAGFNETVHLALY